MKPKNWNYNNVKKQMLLTSPGFQLKRERVGDFMFCWFGLFIIVNWMLSLQIITHP